MPMTQMCAACVRRACDCTAILFRRHRPSPEFTQSIEEQIPGQFCKPAAWQQIFHALRTRGADYVGGEVRLPEQPLDMRRVT